MISFEIYYLYLCRYCEFSQETVPRVKVRRGNVSNDTKTSVGNFVIGVLKTW